VSREHADSDEGGNTTDSLLHVQRARRTWQLSRHAVRLNFEELETIQHIAERAATHLETKSTSPMPPNHFGPSVEAEDWRAYTVTALRNELGSRKVKQISFRVGSGLDFSVRADRSEAIVEVGDADDETLRGLAEQVADVLNGARGLRGRLAAFPQLWWLHAISLLVLFLGVPLLEIVTNLGPSASVAIILFLLVTQCVVLGLLLRGTSVTLARRDESPSFWQRNKDELIIRAIQCGFILCGRKCGGGHDPGG
jgi:hypothetical protein